MPFAELRVSEFLDQLASADPTPGGGTAAAVGAAMGASLLMMVAGLGKTRGGGDEERLALSEARAALAGVRQRLMSLADTDSDAFNQVMSAYRLPKSTDAEKTARKDAIQLALKGATTAPLDTLRATAEAIHLARPVGQYGNRSAVSDVGVGVGLLCAAADGAAANVRINLDGVHDAAFKTASANQVEELLRRIKEDEGAVRQAIGEA